MSSAFVSKSRRVRFDLTLKILDLNNVPLVSGTSFIKWHLPSSQAAEHRGKTNKCVIRDYRVEYGYEKKVQVRLTVGKDGMLQECSIEFEVLQEYSASGRGERIYLGDVKLNLAEYVEASNEPQSPTSPGANSEAAAGEEGVVRRYLMQSSKINSTLKLGIYMKHLDGTRDYYAPPLRTAPVFGGIAGIIHSSEPAPPVTNVVGVTGASNPDPSAGEDVPNFSARNKEVGEMQDMYRRTLAAFWASQPGELKADDAVEDIFSGGDGWGKGGRPDLNNDQTETNGGGGRQDYRDVAFGGTSSRPGSGTTTPNPDTEVEVRPTSKMGPAGRGLMQMGGGRHRHKHSKSRAKPKGQGEVDEVEVRDDLRSWRVGETAAS